MYCSRHMNTKYVKGSHVDKFFYNKFFKSLNELPGQIYEAKMSRKFLLLSSCAQT